MKNFSDLIKNNIYTVSVYARKIAAAATVFVLARYLSVYDYGVFSSYVTIAGYLLIIANLGFNEYILVSSDNNLKEVRIKQSYFIVFAILTTLFYILFSGFFPIEQKLVFKLVLLRSFFDNIFFALILPHFQVAKQFTKIAWINIFYSVGIIVITVFSFIFKLTLVKFLLLCVILGFINFLQCSVGTKINYIMALCHLKEFYKFIDNNFKYFALVTIIMITQAQLYAVCISIFIPKEQAALFFAAYNIVSIIQLFAMAQIQQIMPEMVALTGEGLKKSIFKAQKLLLSVYGVIILFFVVFGKTVLQLIYSKEYYTNAYPILITLSVISLANIGGIYGCAVSAKGLQKEKSKIQLQILAVAAISVLALFKFGMWGLISSFAVSSSFTLIRYFIFCKKQKFI